MIGSFIRNYLVIAVVLFVTAWFLPNVSFGFGVGGAFELADFVAHLPVFIVTAFILTLLSVIARPILELVTAPINFLTLGLFNIVINIAFFFLVTYLVEGFEITGLSVAGYDLPAFFSYAVVAIFFGFVQGLLALIF